jgi:hypothetical protein
MNPRRKIPSNMKTLSTKMLQIPLKMRGSISKIAAKLQGKRTEQQITQKKPNTKENNIKTIPDLL